MDRTTQHIHEVQDDTGPTGDACRRSAHRRRSRMRRQSTGKRIELTARDVEIFRLLDRYRYLRSTFLYAFLGGNRTRFIERLGDLYHEGCIGRPMQQWQFANARYMPAIYELEGKGEGLLRTHGDHPHLSKGRPRASRQFAHQLMIADILASIDLGVRENRGLRFIGQREILDNAPEATRAQADPFRIPVSFTCPTPRTRTLQHVATAVVPDAMFGLEYDTGGTRTYRFFALEADRARMPVTRSDLAQTSYLKKFLAYREIARQGLFKSQLGLPNLLVLTVTVNESHRRTMMAALHNLTAGKGSKLFLFKTLSTLGDFQRAPLPVPDLLATPWERAGYPEFRIDDP